MILERHSERVWTDLLYLQKEFGECMERKFGVTRLKQTFVSLSKIPIN
jgi:hypothetical protein